VAKLYWFKFGSGDPATRAGLSPTFILFVNPEGATLVPPGITEPGGHGLYQFQYGATQGMGFVLDGATTGLIDSERYLSGNVDPVDGIDEQIGTTGDSFGTTATDPSTVLGFLKRSQEISEGDNLYTKSSGKWQLFNRGSTTLLREKTIADGSASITKL